MKSTLGFLNGGMNSCFPHMNSNTWAKLFTTECFVVRRDELIVTMAKNTAINDVLERAARRAERVALMDTCQEPGEEEAPTEPARTLCPVSIPSMKYIFW